jgi:hypothetical protein
MNEDGLSSNDYTGGRIRGVKDSSDMFRNYDQLETWREEVIESISRDKGSRNRCYLLSISDQVEKGVGISISWEGLSVRKDQGRQA